MYRLLFAASLAVSFTLFTSCWQNSRHAMEKTYDAISNTSHEELITIIGIPDESTNNDILIPSIINSETSQLLRRKSYFALYNKETRCPIWVAWRLCASQIEGKIPRDNTYYEDEEVPKPRASNNDYKGSGWSHGHMCPAADNKWDSIAMKESNLLTNICPQDKSLNSGLWNKIEQSCRDWAKKYGDLYIVCGPLFLNKEHEKIGENEVFVPEAFFKVILCLQGNPKALGFIIRNNDGKKRRDQFLNTVDEVERITGIDFFPALPDSIENKVESYSNLEDWK